MTIARQSAPARSPCQARRALSSRQLVAAAGLVLLSTSVRSQQIDWGSPGKAQPATATTATVQPSTTPVGPTLVTKPPTNPPPSSKTILNTGATLKSVATANSTAGTVVTSRHPSAVAVPNVKIPGLTKDNAVPLVAAPANLHPTVDIQECSKHGGIGGGLACKALLPQGQVALVWDWSGTQAIDGYRIYRVDNGQHAVIGTQTAGKDVTVFITTPQNSAVGQCFIAQAYMGATESKATNTACIGGNNVVQTISLSPQQARGTHYTKAGGTGVGETSFNGTGPSSYVVGYQYSTNKAAGGDSFIDTYSREGLFFDLSALMHKHIRSAHLKLTVSTSTIGNGTSTDHRTSCAARIGFGTDYWWKFTDWIEAAISLQPGEVNGPEVSYDVTPMVVNWTQGGSSNYGMVLVGSEENSSAFTEKACLTQYEQHATLEIEYSE